MRRAIILIFLFCTVNCYSQVTLKEWAPIGANWLYWFKNFAGYMWFDRVTVSKDTLIQGRIFKKFDVSALKFNGPDSVSIRDEKYVYCYFIGQVKDTVFQFRFNKLIWYIDPDTIKCMIKPYIDPCYDTNSLIYTLDTFYSITRSNIKYKVRVYSNNIDSNLDLISEIDNSKIGTYGWGNLDVSTSIKKRFFFYSFPNFNKLKEKCTDGTLYGTPVGADVFDCYSDPNVGDISIFMGFCYYSTFKLSSNINANEELKVYPIPFQEKLIIIGNNINKLEILIERISGSIAYKSLQTANNTYEIAHLETGMYILRVFRDKKLIWVNKIIK